MKAHVVLPLLFAFLTCNPQEEVIIDVEPPSIVISSPEEYHFFHPGDTVFVASVIEDNGLLRSVSVHVHDQFIEPPFDTVFVADIRPSNSKCQVDTFWVVNNPVNKNYTIYIDATDQAENYAVSQREFYQYH